MTAMLVEVALLARFLNEIDNSHHEIAITKKKLTIIFSKSPLQKRNRAFKVAETIYNSETKIYFSSSNRDASKRSKINSIIVKPHSDDPP